jgi:hypothetical protein
MRENEGQIAVKQTAISLPPFQPTICQSSHGLNAWHQRTLNGIPYEIEQNPLQKRYEATPQAPRVTVLHRKTNMPFQSNPGY